MDRVIQLLILEDDPIDAELDVHYLRKSGIKFEWKRVETESEFLAALEPPPDLIIADYILPHYDGLTALDDVRKRGLDIPFILISGTAGEDLAVAAMKMGANNYLMKKNLNRLGQAVERELRENELRRQHHQTVKALSASEQKYRQLVETLQEGIWAIDVRGNTTYVNQVMAVMLGYTQPEMLGRNLISFVDEVCLDSARQYLRRRQEGLKEQTDLVLVRKDGARLHLSLTTGPLLDEQDSLMGAIAGVINITDRVRMENALRESEIRYRTVVTAMIEGVVLQDASGAILTANASAERILGLSIDQMIGRTSMDPNWRAIHADGSPFPGDTHPAMLTLQTGEPQQNVIMGIYQPNGQLNWISINSQPLFAVHEEKPYAVVTTFTDITERKTAEDIIRRSEEKYRALADSIQDVFIALDPEFRFTYWNKAAEAMTGIPAGAALGKSFLELFPDQTGVQCQQVFQQYAGDQQPHTFTTGLALGEKNLQLEISLYPSAEGLSIMAKGMSENMRSV